MARQEIQALLPVASLKAVANHISKTPVAHLSRAVPFLTAQLLACSAILSKDHAAGSDAAAAVHQLRTRISSLLQDRSTEGRWAGIVLCKTTVDSGGWQMLHQSAAWVRFLVAILNKPDPPTSKKLCVLTLTRIFEQTHAYSNLIREITTPSLPAFISACLQVLRQLGPQIAPNRLATVVFLSLARLVPNHPAIFRPYLADLQSLTASIRSTERSTVRERLDFTEPTVEAASSLSVALYASAAKPGEARDASLESILRASEDSLRSSLRALFDSDYDTSSASSTKITKPDEICSLIGSLKSFIDCPTTKSVKMPIGRLLHLTIDASIAPSLTRTSSSDPESRKAQDEFFQQMPLIQTHLFDLATALINRLGRVALPAATELLDAAGNLIETSRALSFLRASIYRCIATILPIVGPCLAQSNLSITKLSHVACADLLQDLEPKSESSLNPNAIIGMSEARSSINGSIHLQLAARDLVSSLLRHLPSRLLSKASRAELDRVVILSTHEAPILASLLNVAHEAPSLLPFAARLLPGSDMVESIIRPRLPVVAAVELASGQPDDNGLQDSELNSGLRFQSGLPQGLELANLAYAPSVQTKKSASIPADGDHSASAITESQYQNTITLQPTVTVPLEASSAAATNWNWGEEGEKRASSQLKRSLAQQSTPEPQKRLRSNAAQEVSLLPDGIPLDQSSISDDDDDSDIEIPDLILKSDEDAEDDSD
jgi:pre-rRNA-processing protein RIX1